MIVELIIIALTISLALWNRYRQQPRLTLCIFTAASVMIAETVVRAISGGCAA